MEAKLSDIKTPWEDPKDQLNRKRYSEFLTNYLSSKDSSFVLNLNAPWGMGKTYFITHWYTVIKESHPSVYINAWESDFSSEPLVAVIASIRDQLKPCIPSPKFKTGLEKVISAGGSIARTIGPTLIKGAVKKIAGSDEGQDIIDYTNLSADEIASFAESSMKTLLMAQDKSIKSVTDFQSGLEILLNSINSKKYKLPMFLFIDELDRCRPTYAVELLETVKHLFSIDGIVFVVSTDSDQLQHSVRAIYGSGFAGDLYLKRFFHQEYVLPNPDYLEYCRFKCNQLTLNEDQLHFGHFCTWLLAGHDRGKPESWNDNDNLSIILFFYAQYFSLDLRAIDKIILRFSAITNSTSKRIDGVFLTLLLVLQEAKSGIVKEIIENIKKKNWASFSESLDDIFPKPGRSMLWFYSGMFQSKANRSEYTIAQISRTYLTQISLEFNGDIKGVGDITSLHELVSHYLIQTRQDSNYVSYFDYFNLVEMAGALEV